MLHFLWTLLSYCLEYFSDVFPLVYPLFSLGILVTISNFCYSSAVFFSVIIFGVYIRQAAYV